MNQYLKKNYFISSKLKLQQLKFQQIESPFEMASIIKSIYQILEQARRPIEEKTLQFASQSQGSLQDAFKQIFIYYKQLQKNTQQLGKIAIILYQDQQNKQQEYWKRQEVIEQLNQQIQDFRITINQINNQTNLVYQRIYSNQRQIEVLNRQKQQLQKTLNQHKRNNQNKQRNLENKYNIVDGDRCYRQSRQLSKLKQEVQRLSQLYLLAQQQFQKSKVGTDFLQDQLRMLNKDYQQLKQQYDQSLQLLQEKEILIISLIRDKQQLLQGCKHKPQDQSFKLNSPGLLNQNSPIRTYHTLNSRIIQQISQNQADSSLQSFRNYEYQLFLNQDQNIACNGSKSCERLNTEDSENATNGHYHQFIRAKGFNFCKDQLQDQLPQNQFYIQDRQKKQFFQKFDQTALSFESQQLIQTKLL